VMRKHPDEGARIIERLGFLGDAVPAIRHHHEWIDGTGYPRGLAGDEIPLGARIILVCDAADALTSDRPYRPAQPLDAALAELMRCAGTHFDPRVVAAFCAVATEGRAEAVAAAAPPAGPN
jgi:HD-GYP domain-containing protein (c-di-GMP phosphodiesterase class II)